MWNWHKAIFSHAKLTKLLGFHKCATSVPMTVGAKFSNVRRIFHSGEKWLIQCSWNAAEMATPGGGFWIGSCYRLTARIAACAKGTHKIPDLTGKGKKKKPHIFASVFKQINEEPLVRWMYVYCSPWFFTLVSF